MTSKITSSAPKNLTPTVDTPKNPLISRIEHVATSTLKKIQEGKLELRMKTDGTLYTLMTTTGLEETNAFLSLCLSIGLRIANFLYKFFDAEGTVSGNAQKLAADTKQKLIQDINDLSQDLQNIDYDPNFVKKAKTRLDALTNQMKDSENLLKAFTGYYEEVAEKMSALEKAYELKQRSPIGNLDFYQRIEQAPERLETRAAFAQLQALRTPAPTADSDDDLLASMAAALQQGTRAQQARSNQNRLDNFRPADFSAIRPRPEVQPQAPKPEPTPALQPKAKPAPAVQAMDPPALAPRTQASALKPKSQKALAAQPIAAAPIGLAQKAKAAASAAQNAISQGISRLETFLFD